MFPLRPSIQSSIACLTLLVLGSALILVTAPLAKSAKKTSKTSGAISIGTPRKGDAKNCLGCHGWENLGMDQSLHGQILGKREDKEKGWYCNACHKGDPHGQPIPKDENLCLNCHGDQHEMKGRGHRDEGAWWMSAHRASGMSCVDCHGVHEKEKFSTHQVGGKKNLRSGINELCQNCHRERKNDFRHFSRHPVEDKGMLCTDCHNPHGAAAGTPALLKHPKSELCSGCHQDKEGPFFQEHGAMNEALGGGCTTCHDPHASGFPNLLKTTGRGLCLNCHNDRATHNPGQSCYNSGCHNALHGSNQAGSGAPLGK